MKYRRGKAHWEGRPKKYGREFPGQRQPQLTDRHMKLLATLVSVNGRKEVNRSVGLVRPRNPGRPSSSGGPTEGECEKVARSRVQSRLTDQHMKLLATLVRAHGSEEVRFAAKIVQARKPGRPSRGALPKYERMNLADWVMKRAEIHRRAKRKYPMKLARMDLYRIKNIRVGEILHFEEFRDDVVLPEAFDATNKKEVSKGRRDLKEISRQRF